MFEAQVYKKRREELKKKVGCGVILFCGNNESPMNYPSNVYKFRQDSSFLYYFGINLPNLNAVIDIDMGHEIIFGDDFTMDEIIWMGKQPTLKELASDCAVEHAKEAHYLEGKIKSAIGQGRKVHFLPPYRVEHFNILKNTMGIDAENASHHASLDLIHAVISQREIKSEIEVAEMEKAHATAYKMHTTAMKMTKPGMYERDVAGTIEGIAFQDGGKTSFPSIVSVHGEILHNPYHKNKLKDGDLLLVDCGAETETGYCSDITRTFPVNGKFNPQQKDIYNVVLEAEMKSIEMIKPGILYRDVHLKAAEIITTGLKDLGLMKGDVNAAVENGAHALFFPHGLGHMLGLDVHDMEGLGEKYVGYADKIKRSKQFGLSALRLAKELKQGFVLTVEPGIYFIPALIEKWKSENLYKEFINYDQIQKFIGFGGVRIEDDVLVTASGQKVIGKMIPKSPEDVEAACQK